MNFRPENKAREPGRNDQLPTGTPDIQIARSVAPQSILLLAQQRLGLPAESLIPFGHFKAKVDLSNIDTGTAHGKLVLVTAITPTPAGEGKTTTSVGLNDALNLLGKNSMVCLREPSLGPCFGMPVFWDERWCRRWWLGAGDSHGGYQLALQWGFSRNNLRTQSSYRNDR